MLVLLRTIDWLTSRPEGCLDPRFSDIPVYMNESLNHNSLNCEQL